MAIRSDSVRSTYFAGARSSAIVPEQGTSAAVLPQFASSVWLLAIGLLALCFTQPVLWGIQYPPIWFPSAGIAFTLVAWFGWRAALLPVVAALLAVLLAIAGGSDGTALAGVAADGIAAALEALAGCWLFLRVARSGRRLVDPRSAVEFLLLVPGCAGALGAASRAAVALAAATPLTMADLAALWLGHALGMLAIAPPLLACLTPWLIRQGFTAEDPEGAAPLLPGPIGADNLTPGDAVEIGGLAICAGGLGLLLALAPGHQLLAGWQMWGAPLLLIVWASLRQGLRGGTVVACAAVAVPLAVLAIGPTHAPLSLLLQVNLLAQAGTGLLVAASASWLRSSERRYRQLVAHVPVVVYSVRLRGNPAIAEVTLVSAASTALLGCPPDQFLGDHGRWLEHVHPEDREVVRAAITQLERQSEPVICEYRLAPTLPPDWKVASDPSIPRVRTAGASAPASVSEMRWVRDTLAPQRDDDGRLTGWEGVVADITEQRVLADDLRRASNMLNALVNNLPAGVFFVQGPQGRPILVNARARQLLGQREDATLAQLSSTYRLHRPDWSSYPVDELPVARALRYGQTTMCDDIVVHRPDGRRVPLVTWAAPVQLSGAEPDAAVWVLQDLTALRQAEAARRETEGRLRAVVETMGEALVVLDHKGDVADANHAAAGLFGGDVAGLRGKALTDLGWTWLCENGHPLPDHDHPARVTLRTGRPARGASIGLRRNGGTAGVRWLLVNAMPLSSPPAGVVATFSDLTAYHQNRKAARPTEENYRSLVESLPVTLLQTDCGLRVKYCNAAIRSATGYEVEEIATPELVAAKINPDDLPRLCALAGSALAGHSGRGDCRIRAKDGAEKTIQLMLEPRREGGEIVGVTALLLEFPHMLV
jgi:PAS domain S-box-containing protein